MKRRFLARGIEPSRISTPEIDFGRSLVRQRLLRGAVLCAMAVLTAGSGVQSGAQVLTVDTSGGKGAVAGNGPVDHQYTQIAPTHVELSKTVLDPKTRLLLIRALMSEQGFAMRPFPRGHKGLTLQANGKLDPAGVAYLNMVINEGLSAKPGSRVVITDVKVEKSKIVLDLNGGPDAKHRFLRHIQISAGPDIGDPDVDPSQLNQAGEPSGSRLNLTFAGEVPELTPAEVKALVAPLISFDVKTPVQAFTDTLPPALKDAILNHKVWVGMSTEMVFYAKGRPNTKSREMEGQMPFEVWIYGTPPDDVTFVKINGNRVLRVEIAKMGQPIEIFTKDVVTPLLVASGSPELASDANTRVIHEGDVETDPNKQEAAPPPSLRNPGENLPTDNQSTGVMRPVQFPKPHPDEEPGANPDEQSSAPPASTPSSPNQPAQSGNAQPPPQNSSSGPSGGTQAQPQSAPAKTEAPSGTQAPAGGSQQPAPPANQLVATGGSGQQN